jgi:glycosyltransferase involved in cell wall biosynthesis
MTNKSMPRRLRVLMSAYACEPGKGSEPGVGWNLARAMAKRHDVWVLTRANNRVVIEAELEERPVPNLHFLYYDLPRWGRWWKRGGRGVQAYYYLWQLGAARVARLAHEKLNFDIAHHVTFVKYWAPAAAGFAGIPFVWGPVGGGESMPRSFLYGLSRRSKIHEWARLVARRLSEFDPWVRTTARRAKIAVGTTPETVGKIRKITRCPLMELSQVAITSEEWSCAETHRRIHKDDGSVFLSAGNLLGLKGYHLAIRAFAQADLPDARYVILGGGPEKGNLKALAKELGVQDRVEIVGSVPRPEVLERLRTADIFLHPSLHDSGGLATLEAMAAGLPVICLDIGGPAVQVNSKVGRKIAAINPDQAVDDLSKAMRELALDLDLRGRLGKAARQHVALEFTWESKVDKLSQVYEQVLADVSENRSTLAEQASHSALK